MAKKPKTRITKEQLDLIERGKVRDQQKEQGAFDGRFVTRSEDLKTRYKRHKKHRKEDDNN